LINDILDLAKIESGKRELIVEPVSVESVIAEVSAALSSSAAAKGLNFTIAAPGAALELRTDRRALHQILLNLTNNAIKYTETGSVRIETHEATWDGAPAIAIDIVDTGIGIKREDLQRLFEAFKQLDTTSSRRFEGTGLGLYLSRSLALLLGGTLNVVSEPGRGSTFTLTLPLSASPFASAPE
jgi:protein-histidine pros-kinase